VSIEFIGQNKTATRTIPIHQYDSLNVGDIIEITMYSKGDNIWFFSKEEIL